MSSTVSFHWIFSGETLWLGFDAMTFGIHFSKQCSLWRLMWFRWGKVYRLGAWRLLLVSSASNCSGALGWFLTLFIQGQEVFYDTKINDETLFQCPITFVHFNLFHAKGEELCFNIYSLSCVKCYISSRGNKTNIAMSLFLENGSQSTRIYRH